MSRHLNPTPPAGDRRRLDIAIAGTIGLGLLAATCGIANAAAPHAHAPVTVAAPTAVDLREPTGHGGLGGPLATPSIGADGAWLPKYGPVIVDGQALAKPTVVAPEPEPIPESSPTPTPVPAPPVAPATTTEPTPVVVVPEPTEPEVTEPELTEPDATTPVETTPPTEPPAEPTVPVVDEHLTTDVAA